MKTKLRALSVGLIVSFCLISDASAEGIKTQASPSSKSWIFDRNQDVTAPRVIMQDLQTHSPWIGNFPKKSRFIFAPCKSKEDANCIESIEGRVSNEGEWLPFVPGVELHASLGLSGAGYKMEPNQSYPRIWLAPAELATESGSEYLVRAFSGDFEGIHFGLSPISRGMNGSQEKDCPATYLETPCLRIYNHPRDAEYRMSIRLDSVLSQKSAFIAAKLIAPSVSFSEVDGHSKLILSGKPTISPSVKAKLTIENMIKQFPEIAQTQKNRMSAFPIQIVDGTEYSRFLDNISNGFENSIGEISAWHFDLNNLGTVKCLKSTEAEVGGLISTNALAIAQEPPVWNSDSKTLTYRIASSHFLSDSSIQTGYFSAILSIRAAECFWGTNFDKNKLEVEVTSADGNKQIAVSSSNLRDGSFYFYATGFHYSANSVVLSLKSKISLPTSITCTKGKQSKKISGLKPTCPKGFQLKK